MPTVGGYVGTMRCDATAMLAVPGRAVSKGALSWRRSRRAPPGARVICTPMVVWDGSWQSVSAWRCRSCRVAGWDAKAELATGCCAFGRVEGGVGRGSCAVRLGIDWLGSAVARRALNRTKCEVSARRQMAEALRWLSEARRQHCYVYGPLPIAARGICPVARELGARGKIASGCVSTYLKLWRGGSGCDSSQAQRGCGRRRLPLWLRKGGRCSRARRSLPFEKGLSPHTAGTTVGCAVLLGRPVVGQPPS